MTEPALVEAAGAVVLRRTGGRGPTAKSADEGEVLLVHRPKYDDWAFPKGKLDPHEPPRTAAVREVWEETGVRIRLGPPLPPQAYPFGPRHERVKLVHYWIGRAVADHDVTTYAPNDEIDAVRWVPLGAAAKLLTYPRDRQTLAEARQLGRGTSPLLVVRHAEARDRKSWRGDDRERTLTKAGERQAARLVPVLEAYGVTRLVSSSSRRCWTTLAPYAEAAGLHLDDTDALSEEDATPKAVTKEVARLTASRRPAAVCSHRPVLPWLFEALHLDPAPLELGGIVVVHHRDGRIAALERVAAPSRR